MVFFQSFSGVLKRSRKTEHFIGYSEKCASYSNCLQLNFQHESRRLGRLKLQDLIDTKLTNLRGINKRMKFKWVTKENIRDFSRLIRYYHDNEQTCEIRYHRRLMHTEKRKSRRPVAIEKSEPVFCQIIILIKKGRSMKNSMRMIELAIRVRRVVWGLPLRFCQLRLL